MVLPADPQASDDTTVVGGVRIGPGMLLSLHEIDYFPDFDWLTAEPDKMLILDITYVREVQQRQRPGEDLAEDWVIIVGHEWVNGTMPRCHCVAVRVSALAEALKRSTNE